MNPNDKPKFLCTCNSTSHSVSLSVCQSITHLEILAGKLFNLHESHCPPTTNWCCHVYGLVFSFFPTFYLHTRNFLVACTRLYKSLCRSVGRLVRPSVRPSVRQTTFSDNQPIIFSFSFPKRAFTVGDDFQLYKQLLVDLLHPNDSDDPSDIRSVFPYIFITFSQKVQPRFRIKQNLFNLSNRAIKPFLPPSLITLKSHHAYV